MNSLVLVSGTPDGFKGWKRKYSSGYVAVAKKLYLMFRCGKEKTAERSQRVRRQPLFPPFPPRPCVNDTMAGSANDEDECENGVIVVDETAEEQSEVGNGEE